MASRDSRRRTSSALSSKAGVTNLQNHIQCFSSALGNQDQSIVGKIQRQIHAGHCIRQLLLEDPDLWRVQDVFRHLNGFQAVHTNLESISQIPKLQASKIEEISVHLELLQTTFGVLNAALQDHKGNQKYFQQHPKVGGWERLSRALEALLESANGSAHAASEAIIERLFGCLIFCATGDEMMVGFFGRLRRQIHELSNQPNSALSLNDLASDSTTSCRNTHNSNEKLTDVAPVIGKLIAKEMASSNSLQISQPMAIMFELWKKLQLTLSAVNTFVNSILLGAPCVLTCLATLSTHNLLALHGTSLLTSVISYLLAASATDTYASELRSLAVKLLQLGITGLEDAHLLFRKATTSSMVADLLLIALSESRSPSYVHFDLSMHGFASIELSELGYEFPPVKSSAGYTLSLWLYVVEFDENAHTTLFGAFDSSQICFVLVYLEKDTHNIILQTSVISSRPSVRFKSIALQENRWYHVVIVHRQPKPTSSSRASLFVDGEFVEQVKAQYPISPSPHSSPSLAAHTGRSSTDSNRNDNAVQAFLGTPQDLASRLGKCLISSQWRLASAHLFGEVLSDDLIAVYFQLGPRYSGNYQDCLGSFQTYQASAELNLRNESLHPGKEEKSDIVSAIRSKASVLLPESAILLAISPTTILVDGDQHNFDETPFVKYLSNSALRNLQSMTRSGRNAIAINGSIPSINDALSHRSGFAVLTGNPAVAMPQSLDDAAWRVGGCAAVGLALLEAAHKQDSILRALKILFGTIQDNWRNSEAMERDNGFGALANLLAAKLNPGNTSLVDGNDSLMDPISSNGSLESLSKAVLMLVLEFIGYQINKPQDSVINNPLAYRVLLVDTDIWRTAAPSVQKLYYQQFTIFGVGSKYHQFNAKRLSRMRIMKKWLEALKGETFTIDSFAYFMEAFRSLLTNNLSAESLRTIALYITYGTRKLQPNSSQSLRHARSMEQQLKSYTRRATITDVSLSPEGPKKTPDSTLSPLQAAFEILYMYSDILCKAGDVTNIKKFARTVTNKWLLHLLAHDEARIVILTTKILARLLVTNGSAYVEKFADKTGGISIMQYRLKRWWRVPAIWSICFAILFGQDVANINLKRPFDLNMLLESFTLGNGLRVAYPEMLPVLAGMLHRGLSCTTKGQEDSSNISDVEISNCTASSDETSALPRSACRRSMLMNNDLAQVELMDQPIAESASVLNIVVRFLTNVHTISQSFRDFAVSSIYVQELLFVLFPIIMGSDIISPETEIKLRDSALTLQSSDTVARSFMQSSTNENPTAETDLATPVQTSKPTRSQLPKRISSYILISPPQLQDEPLISKLQVPMVVGEETKNMPKAGGPIVKELLDIIISVFSDQLLSRKEFLGLGLFMKVPPGLQEQQVHFESFVLHKTLSTIGNTVKSNQTLLLEPRVLTNLARFAGHLGESLYEGWFVGGAEAVLDFLAQFLEYLQLPVIRKLKSIRLCDHAVSTIKTVLQRAVLFRLSELKESASATETVSFLEKLAYWQTVLFSVGNGQIPFLKMLCHLLYAKLISKQGQIRMAATNLWRMLLVQKRDEILGIFTGALPMENSNLTNGFKSIMEVDNEIFLEWVDEHRQGLDTIFKSGLAKAWERLVTEENAKTVEISRARISKRREKLKAWVAETHAKNDLLRRHEISSDHWHSNIYASEQLKKQRALQDQQDNRIFNDATWAKMKQVLYQPGGLFHDHTSQKWELDQTEGRNRMRVRFIPDKGSGLYEHQAKRQLSEDPAKHRSSLSSQLNASSKEKLPGLNFKKADPTTNGAENAFSVQSSGFQEIFDETLEQEDDFEIINDPREVADNYEDKNRKVMRSLQRGDQVDDVHNVSRIIGLEACEGLLILGKEYLYLLDNFFQRSDGEIVNVWQAPSEERDPYLQMISGREAKEQANSKLNTGHETRSWRWDEVLSISKRRFLFRDVAVEIFFVDGRSYLLTAKTLQLRDELFQKMLGKAPNIGGRTSISCEESWRMDSIRNPEQSQQTLGSRFTSVFAQTLSNPITKRWIKGEISNFHYLMMINTMAGRTFNDLTQYPVFPWVLSDYTSDDLDLSNPQSFRDLAKPMGCQTPLRQAEFRSRYDSFAEMGDNTLPPFHYGTHYSSAMIVTSYLIRLRPFVQSYLLLQGGSFDHPDRLFYSIEKAWSSASSENMSDVRELIPEFYYLPEFLRNSNGFDFGLRQGDGGKVDLVTLPPWAKGDPNIFIAKHREALESEHVSRHLHHWIDLVFGQKQRGEAALEATNVFHHLSYQGAKDLETIKDPNERLATIGIIHNFGQTPHQVFQRSHPQWDGIKYKMKKLDTIAESLVRLPFPVLEHHDRVSFLVYSSRHDRLLCSGGLRLDIGPLFDIYMQWGFSDGSVRFYNAETKKLLGLFEHVHQGQLSVATLADSKTLVTAGTDCTISVWSIISTSKSVDLQPKASFFGHRSPVTVLSVSDSFRALLSASSDGQVLLWDLNQLDLVRKLASGDPVECARINDITGVIMLCRGRIISLFTLNGDLLLDQDICADVDDIIVSCAFYEGSGNEYLARDLIFTGHKRGIVNIWSKVIQGGGFLLERVKRMHHLDQAGYNIISAMTFILPLAQTVYTADEDGRVHEWDCIQRHDGR